MAAKWQRGSSSYSIVSSASHGAGRGELLRPAYYGALLRRQSDDELTQHSLHSLLPAGGSLFPTSGASTSFHTELDSNSMLSWGGEDDYERRSSRAVQAMLRDLDSILYGDAQPAPGPAARRDPSPPHHRAASGYKQPSAPLIAECAEWSTVFPHLRLSGTRMLSGVTDDGVQLVTVRRRSKTAVAGARQPIPIPAAEFLDDSDRPVTAPALSAFRPGTARSLAVHGEAAPIHAASQLSAAHKLSVVNRTRLFRALDGIPHHEPSGGGPGPEPPSNSSSGGGARARGRDTPSSTGRSSAVTVDSDDYVAVREFHSATPTAACLPTEPAAQWHIEGIDEEVLAIDGELEEYLACDVTNDEDPENRNIASWARGLPPLSPRSCAKDAIACEVFDDLWGDLVPAFRPLLGLLSGKMRRPKPGSSPDVAHGRLTSVSTIDLGDEVSIPVPNVPRKRPTDSARRRAQLVFGEQQMPSGQLSRSHLQQAITIRPLPLESRVRDFSLDGPATDEVEHRERFGRPADSRSKAEPHPTGGGTRAQRPARRLVTPSFDRPRLLDRESRRPRPREAGRARPPSFGASPGFNLPQLKPSAGQAATEKKMGILPPIKKAVSPRPGRLSSAQRERAPAHGSRFGQSPRRPYSGARPSRAKSASRSLAAPGASLAARRPQTTDPSLGTKGRFDADLLRISSPFKTQGTVR